MKYFYSVEPFASTELNMLTLEKCLEVKGRMGYRLKFIEDGVSGNKNFIFEKEIEETDTSLGEEIKRLELEKREAELNKTQYISNMVTICNLILQWWKNVVESGVWGISKNDIYGEPAFVSKAKQFLKED